MTVTPEQQRYARLTGVMIVVHGLIEIGADYPTIIARGGETFAQTAQYATEHALLWRGALMALAVAWVTVVIVGFTFYVTLAPAGKRLAQLGLLLRVGGAAIGASSLMFRSAKARLQLSPPDTFTPEQIVSLSGLTQSGSNAGIYMSWIFMGLSSLCFFTLFFRAGYMPRLLAGFAIFTSLLLASVAMISMVLPQYAGTLKGLLVLSLVSEIAVATWLLTKGLRTSAA